jgi:hypothetical protein
MMGLATTANAGTAHVVGAVSDSMLTPPPPDAPVRDSWLDVGASSWSPEFTLPSRLSGNNVPLQTNSPALDADYTFQITPHSREWNGKVGLGWLSVARTAALNLGDDTTLATQSAQFFSAHIGVEYVPNALRTAALEPYLGFALLPSAVLTSDTPFANGTSYFGLPVEFALGTRVELRSIGIPWEGSALDLSGTETLGHIDGSSISGFGIRAGLRVVL